MQESITSDGSRRKNREILRSRAPCCEEFPEVLQVTQGNYLEIDIKKMQNVQRKTWKLEPEVPTTQKTSSNNLRI